MTTKKQIAQNVDKLIQVVLAIPEKKLDLNYVATMKNRASEPAKFNIKECGAVCCIAGSAAASNLFPQYDLEAEMVISATSEMAYEVVDENGWHVGYSQMAYELLGREGQNMFSPRGGLDQPFFEEFLCTGVKSLALDGKPISDRTLALARLFAFKNRDDPSFSDAEALKMARSHESRT